MGYGSGILEDPSAGLAPIRNAAATRINKNYAGAPDLISRMMASRGYGSSGAMGDTLYKTELARLGDISGLEGDFAGLGIQRQQGAGDLLTRLLSTQVGSSQTGSSTTKTMDPFSLFSGLGTMLTMPLGGAGSSSILGKLFK